MAGTELTFLISSVLEKLEAAEGADSRVRVGSGMPRDPCLARELLMRSLRVGWCPLPDTLESDSCEVRVRCAGGMSSLIVFCP